MGIYNFNPEDAERFAFAVRAKTKRKGNELEFAVCPYCKSSKDKGTFSINLRTGQFECKRNSCGYKGNMITLSRDFADVFELSRDVTRYYNVNDFNNRFKSFRDAHRQIESKPRAVEYLEARGISEHICKKYELTVKEGTDNVLVFPFKDEEGELKFIKYRNMDYEKGVSEGSKEWCESDCMPILFGMNHCSDSGTLVMTEGQLDSLSLAEAGIQNAVSVPTGANGFTWVPHCWDWLQKYDNIIVFGDFEKGKITLSEEMMQRMPGKIKTVLKEAYKECKDANEILQKYGKSALIEAVNTAAAPKCNYLLNCSEVEMIDIENTESISTGLPYLDRILSGGFHVGQLIILTGKRGDGKSTMMSQFICRALQQEYSTFCYSGELVDFFFKNWIDRQLVGKKDLLPSEVDKVNKWYNNRLFLFNNKALIGRDVTETDAILEAIESAIIQLSVKFICIDNLMTAITLDPHHNTYESQSKFVGSLANLCKQYNVIILLVAHPKKDTGFKTDDNDMISGSGDITNKADIVLRYERYKPQKSEEPETIPPRGLSVLKNRLTGKTTGDYPIKLWFEENSKRISSSRGCFDWDYFSKNDDFEQIGLKEIPF